MQTINIMDADDELYALESDSDVDMDDANVGQDDHAEADEEFRRVDASMDAWLARNPGGTRLLYPQLYFVQEAGGRVIKTPAKDSSIPCIFDRLPLEVRTLIYKWYFQSDGDNDLDRAVAIGTLEQGIGNFQPAQDEQFVSFPGSCKEGITRLHLASEDIELKYWLSSPLLRASRQIRLESLPVFLGSRIFTTEWFTVIPRFIDFLGKEGCAAIRYIDLWGATVAAESPRARFRLDESGRWAPMLASLKRFPRLKHLRIVLSAVAHPAWYDDADYETNTSKLRKEARPKMKLETLSDTWPEYTELEQLATQDFTLAYEAHQYGVPMPLVEKPGFVFLNRYAEFEKDAGAFPGLLRCMRAKLSQQEGNASSALLSTSSTREVDRYNGVFLKLNCGNTPAFDPTAAWQETDSLTDKTIALYNFTLSLALTYDGVGSLGHILCLPRAPKSSGATIRNCSICYYCGRHCTFHGLPSFESLPLDAEQQYEQLQFSDMLEAASGMIDLVSDHVRGNQFFRVLTVQQYMGWPELVSMPSVSVLEDAVMGQTFGKAADKSKFKIWALVYRGIWARFK
jgi:hypothetical protein